jgi:hypothetical protein
MRGNKVLEHPMQPFYRLGVVVAACGIDVIDNDSADHGQASGTVYQVVSIFGSNDLGHVLVHRNRSNFFLTEVTHLDTIFIREHRITLFSPGLYFYKPPSALIEINRRASTSDGRSSPR